MIDVNGMGIASGVGRNSSVSPKSWKEKELSVKSICSLRWLLDHELFSIFG